MNRENNTLVEKKHIHDQNIMCIHVVNSVFVTIEHGVLSLYLDDANIYSINQSECLFIPKNTRINIISTSQYQNVRVIDIPITIMSELYPTLNKTKPIKKGGNIYKLSNSIEHRIIYRSPCNELIKKIFSEFNERKSPVHNDHQMKKTMIFILLNNLVNMSGFIDLLAKCIKPTLHERVYDLVTRELNKKWTIKKITSALEINESSLKRQLVIEGTSTKKIVNEARFNMAIRLIRGGKHKIKDIVLMCGIKDKNTIQFLSDAFFNN